jgi:cytoskeletal protein CcmA (bactofilin family)
MGLFAKKTADQPPPALPATTGGHKAESYFGRNLAVTGRISGEDNLNLHGCLEGDIELAGHLVIGRDAVIEGTATADRVTAGGRFSGTLTADTILQIESGASICGNVKTPRLTVQEGALFNGELKMGTREQGGSSDEN